MAHLHIPDGLLPLWLWAPGLAAALALLVVSTRVLRHANPQSVAYQGSLGALALAAMAFEIPLGPIDYHLSLLGPIGVLMGPAAAFQVLFVVSGILALMGHGGLTVIGLNALVLGSGAALARPVYRRLKRGRPAAFAMALSTASAQAASGALWLFTMAVALRSGWWTTHASPDPGRFTVFAAIALPMWIAGILVEAAVAYGIARFIERVRPDLLPGEASLGPRVAERTA